MKKFHMIAGLPRSGSTLLCNLLNINPAFNATPTSGVIDILKSIRSNFSHNVNWKTRDRIKILDNIQKGMKGFLEGFYEKENVVFDKCRGWSNNIAFLDAVLGHSDSKIIWTYRDPVDVVGSIEAQYKKTILLENTDEAQAPGAFITLDRRIGTLIGDGGIVSHPIEILRDAVESGYADRILIITFYDITNNTQAILDSIHDFLGEERYEYDFKKLKQSTYENDSFYNHKFPHTIREGEIKWKKSDITLPEKYINGINERFVGLNKLVFEGNPDSFLGAQPMSQPSDVETKENADNPFID